ncbi:MAG: sulfite exporter TauE/SafE family protein, partial [Anaerolineae bacterium]|nr:sulfite exporter TauE/SafE family protein [Anaerolineae bacterium]
MEIALQIAMFAAAGFLAQIIDGALGMAYGVSSTTFLLALGVPPAAASASVHAAEVITTGVSGLSHLRLGNVKRRLALRLLVPGVAGAVVGAYILTRIPGEVIRPFIAAYLAIMGIVILAKAIQGVRHIDHELPDWEIIPLG